MKPKKIFLPLILAVALAALPPIVVWSGFLESWELTVYDTFCRSQLEDGESDRISLVLIDNQSIEWGMDYYERYERLLEKGLIESGGLGGKDRPDTMFLWPWKRSVYELIVSYLIEQGARVIAFDMDFSSTHNSGDTGDDVTLADAVMFYHEEGAARIIHTLNFQASDSPIEDHLAPWQEECLRTASLPVPGIESSPYPFYGGEEGTYYDPILPYRDLVSDSEGNALGGTLRLGAVMAQPDKDAVIRRARVLTRYKKWIFPSLGLAAVLAHMESTPGMDRVSLKMDGGNLVLRSNRIPLTSSGDILIHWKDKGLEGYEGPGRFKTYPAFRILLLALDAYYPKLIDEFVPKPEEAARFRKVGEGEFKDRIVFIGATATALWDLKATPIEEKYPGVKIHAALADNLLDGDPIRRAPLSVRTAAAAVLALLTILAVLLLGKTSLKFVTSLALMSAYALFAYLLFCTRYIWIDTVIPLLGILFAYTGGTTYSYFTEGRQKRQIIKVFQQTAPPLVVKRLASNPDSLTTQGERVEITAFFSDIKGFTRLANAPDMRNNPDLLTDHLNRYLSEMTSALLDCGGTLDKYIGDAVVAFFGAPLSMDNHALAACRAALACQERIVAFNSDAAKKGLPELQTRIGLYSGEAMVGFVGSRSRVNYTAIGSTVNFGSRLEGVNKIYGTWILAGAPTMARAGNDIRARFIDRVRVPGVEKDAPPLEVHQVLGLAGALNEKQERMVVEFNRAMERYIDGRFAEAIPLFDACIKRYDDPPSRVFADRSRNLAENPPSDWDGVWRIRSK